MKKFECPDSADIFPGLKPVKDNPVDFFNAPAVDYARSFKERVDKRLREMKEEEKKMEGTQAADAYSGTYAFSKKGVKVLKTNPEVIRLHYVNSTMARAIGYNSDTETLFIEYHTGVVYRYPYVSAKTWAQITEAESIGQALQPIIKDAGRDWTKQAVRYFNTTLIEGSNLPVVRYLDTFTDDAG